MTVFQKVVLAGLGGRRTTVQWQKNGTEWILHWFLEYKENCLKFIYIQNLRRQISALQYCQYFDFIWPNLSRFQNIKWNALYAVQCTHIDWLTFWLPLHTMRSMLQKTNFTVSNMNHLCSLSPQMCLNIRLIFACSQQTRPVRQVYHTQHANVYVNNNIGSGNMKYLHHFQQFFNLM